MMLKRTRWQVRARLCRALLVWLTLSPGLPTIAENWPTWRGPRGDGTSLETNTPLNSSSLSNVLWKTALPGIGHASPIVWNRHVFTVTCLPDTEQRVLLGLDLDDGHLRWRQTVITSPLERKHPLNSYASSTPATDGERVYATFLDGKEMLVVAFDLQGRPAWSVRPGAFSSIHGFCSSPILHGNLVIVNGDHDGDSYLVALDRSTGQTVWKTPRRHHTRSYCVPLIRTVAGRTQMALSGDQCVTSYDPDTGQLRWIIEGPTEQFVASLVYSERTSLFYLTAGYPEHHILAIRPDGEGDVTQTHIVWRTHKGAAYVPSPIVEGDYFLVVSDSGVAHCFEAATGKIVWQERMGEHHASLVSADGLVCFLNDEGTIRVVRPGPEYRLLAQSEVGEPCFASPAITQGLLLIRGNQHLFCIGAGQKPRVPSRRPQL